MYELFINFIYLSQQWNYNILITLVLWHLHLAYIHFRYIRLNDLFLKHFRTLTKNFLRITYTRRLYTLAPFRIIHFDDIY